MAVSLDFNPMSAEYIIIGRGKAEKIYSSRDILETLGPPIAYVQNALNQYSGHLSFNVVVP